MKYTTSILIIAGFVTCFCACKNDNISKEKIEADLYSRLGKRLDSFSTETLPFFSPNRVKKLAQRLEQTDAGEEVVLDTLPDNSTIAVKQVKGNAVYYHKDKSLIKELYVKGKNEFIPRPVLSISILEIIRKEKCEHWRKICNDPDLPASHEFKLICKLNIKYYCD